MLVASLLTVCAAWGQVNSSRVQEFVCPTASGGCNFYRELVEAKDEDITQDDLRYVCFREYGDDFFLITISQPYASPKTWYQWDVATKLYELNYSAKARATFSARSYHAGVEASTSQPGMFLIGSWQPGLNTMLFNAADSHETTTAYADKSQLTIVRKYESVSDKKIEYSLTIQRSTLRFAEEFNVVGNAKDSFTQRGRCSEVNPLPQIPKPPPLTQEQKDERDKFEYCENSPEASDKEYCASSITYRDDYEVWRSKKQPAKK